MLLSQMRIKQVLLACALLLALPSACYAAEGFSAAQLSIAWAIPFAGMLLSIAVMPLVAPFFWHHHYGKVAVFWALIFFVPFAISFGWSTAAHELAHTIISEYLPFIILLLSLFVVSGGLRLKGQMVGTPAVNCGILLFGSILASWIGTTGAAMLLIRPLLRANQHRQRKAHTVIFFIFLVANIGGCLTPLGDPPLFLGFLKGVSFFWTAGHLFLPFVLLCILLLALYYVIDRRLYLKEGSPKPQFSGFRERLGFEGIANIPLLLLIIGFVLLSGSWNPGTSVSIFGTAVPTQNIVRDIGLLALALISIIVTNPISREMNGFTWEPILEVAKLFLGIFITIIPVIAILGAGAKGAMAPVVSLVSNSAGEPNNIAYFWTTGILSSFLDNAPTYLVFFNTAGGDAQHLMADLPHTLMAISAGAVFFGAVTYIGNAPNFMVRSIADGAGVKMPGFFGYMIWSLVVLFPMFAIVTAAFML